MTNKPRVTDHEGHFFCGHRFRCDDEIAFVLAVHRIKDNDEFAISCSSCQPLWVPVWLEQGEHNKDEL